MNKPFGNDDPRIAEHVGRTFAPGDDVLKDVCARQESAGMPDIQVAALDGLHLEVIARAIGARRVVEIGTLGGYSGVCLLRGMVPGGVLHTFELDPKHAEVARETFRRAGVEARVRIHVGEAATLLARIEGEGPFDLVFIDADKQGYPAYLDWAARNLRTGGVVLGDNAFLFGEIVAPARPGREAVHAAMLAFHDRLAHGGEFKATILPTGEGLAMGVKLG